MKTIADYKTLIKAATTKKELNEIAYAAFLEDTAPIDENYIIGESARNISDIVLNMCLRREAQLGLS